MNHNILIKCHENGKKKPIVTRATTSQARYESSIVVIKVIEQDCEASYMK